MCVCIMHTGVDRLIWAFQKVCVNLPSFLLHVIIGVVKACAHVCVCVSEWLRTAL